MLKSKKYVVDDNLYILRYYLESFNNYFKLPINIQNRLNNFIFDLDKMLFPNLPKGDIVDNILSIKIITEETK